MGQFIRYQYHGQARKDEVQGKSLLFKYKGDVSVPALEMVDDIADIQKCGDDAVKANAVVNTFIEHKKLTLSSNKCHKIHCGKKSLKTVQS